MKRFFNIIAVFLVAVIFSGSILTPTVAVAVSAAPSFDDTDVLEDLSSSSINGQPFDLSAYPRISLGEESVITVVEYCYSYSDVEQNDYGLYIYFYNPRTLNFDTASLNNKVQLAISYNAAGSPSDYEKFQLKFCSKSMASGYENVFYKFRVVDHVSGDGKLIVQRINQTSRRYDISGVELVVKNAPNAVDYGFGFTCLFTGYAAGYGADSSAASTLNCVVNKLETISLDVHHTNYRTGISSAGAGHQNELNSVYFSVPNSFLDTYGKLQRIKAEWYEYKTSPVVVTSDKAMYDKVLNYLGQVINDYSSAAEYQLFGGYQWGDTGGSASWGWNVSTSAVYLPTEISLLAYLFYTSGSISDYIVTSEALSDWIYSYNLSYLGGYALPIKSGSISAGLFAAGVDAGRTKGYNVKDFDAGDTFDMFSYDSNHNGWQKFFDYFFSAPNTGGDFTNIVPIYAVGDGDLWGSDVYISEQLFINKNDVSDFKSFYNAEKSLGNTVFLFRFALTDYFTENVAYLQGRPFFLTFTTGKAYATTETVFFDFDIIQLTFNKAGVYTVIPVVSNPIDIINAITPPLEPPDAWAWFKELLAIVIFVLVLLVLVRFYPIVRDIIKGLLYLVCLPFRLIGRLLRGVKKNE